MDPSGEVAFAGATPRVVTHPGRSSVAGSVAPMTTALMAGAEPYSATGGPGGVLVLHGFTGNPSSMRSLSEALAREGWAVELPRLPGHGTSVEDMMTTRWSDWTGAALDAYDALAASHPRVAVVGLSMGGGLAAYVATQRPVAGCVFINPLVKAPAPELVAGVDELLASGVALVDAIGSDVKKEGVSESSYASTPLVCAQSLFSGVAQLYDDLVSVRAPSLLLQSREDHVVSADNGEDLFARVSGPIERIWLEDSYHVATLDNDRELVENEVVAFTHRVLGE